MSKQGHAKQQEELELPQSLQEGKGFSEDNPIDTFDDLQLKVQNLNFDDDDSAQKHLYISERLMKMILKKSKTEHKSVMFGSPGIRLYVPGAKTELDRLERMPAEAYGDFIAKREHELNRPR